MTSDAVSFQVQGFVQGKNHAYTEVLHDIEKMEEEIQRSEIPAKELLLKIKDLLKAKLEG